MQQPADQIFYEQPLSERIRAFLRLEFLFHRAQRLLPREDAWSSRTTLETIIDIMAILSRSDLKKELIKELERHAGTLESLAQNPNVDEARLLDILNQVRNVLATLHDRDHTPGHELRYNELLGSVRQRSSIPAGTCHFDLPAYHYWLQRPAAHRHQDLQEWISAFDVLREAIGLCLTLVRESAVATQEVATTGFFQRNLGTSTPCQMIRVALGNSVDYYPEISAGKHRFTVRFMHPGNGANRPVQTNQDVDFELLCCVI